MSLRHLGPVNRFSEIDSTNRYLADEARNGAASGLVAVADHQSAGRGRLGRTWQAPPGANLLMSVLLRPDEGVAPFDLTVATALAAADACKVVAEVDPRLKWPNDLVVMGRKLAGILAEIVTVSPSDPVGRDAVVVGLGLNVNWAPPDEEMSEEKRSGTKRPLFATSLALTSGLTGRIDVDPKDPKDADQIDTDKLLTEVLEHLDRRITDLSEQQGATEQMKEYRSRSALIGKEVVIYVPEGQVRGVVANVSDDGHLVVTCNDRDTNRLVNRVFTTGDVFGVGTVSYGPLPASGRA